MPILYVCVLTKEKYLMAQANGSKISGNFYALVNKKQD